jgi:Tfp pilus assembly protein PilE
MNKEATKHSSTRIKLVIALLIVIILAILAAIFIPRYNNYLRNKSAAEGKLALEALRNTVDNYWKTNGSISGISTENAIVEAGIKDKVAAKWQFAIAWKETTLYTTEMVNKLKDVNTNQMVYVSPYKMIMAVATDANKLREGTKIWFEGDTNQFHGYGVDELVEPNWISIFPNP